MMIHLFDVDCRQRRVMVRVDFNVPMQNGQIMDEQRLRAGLPCIKWLLNQNAGVLLLSHVGRPKAGALTQGESLAPVAAYLSKALSMDVPLVDQWLDGIALEPGTVTMAENVRALAGETKNNTDLSKAMAAQCDVFVMDAFATAHRAHASTCGVIDWAPVACQGPLLKQECDALRKVCQDPEKPVLTIVGGAKIASKLGLLAALIKRTDTLIVGGGMANTLLRAQGVHVGASLCEHDLLPQAKALLSQAKDHGVTVGLPVDVRVVKQLSDTRTQCKAAQALADDDIIVDIGPETENHYDQLLRTSNTVLWNGPLGIFERPAFAHGTKHLAHSLAAHNAYCVAGGGDTVAAINEFKVGDQLSYVSTGGGALLQYLEGTPLPSLVALQKAATAKQ